MPSCEAQTAHQMNHLQVQIAQCQESLRQRDFEIADMHKHTIKLETEARIANFNLRQSKTSRTEIGKQLQDEQFEKGELHKALEIQEAGKENLEREKAELWKTIQKQAKFIHSLRNHLDGPKLSAEERCVDVAQLLADREKFKLEVNRLKAILIART